MIRRWPDPALDRVAQAVRDPAGLDGLVDEMWDEMLRAGGVGLAANQIGRPEALFVAQDVDADGHGGGRIVVVNPVVVKASHVSQIGEEGCLSRPGEWHVMERPERLVVRGMDERGRERTWQVRGYQARIFAHEIDHLTGRLIGPGTPGWRQVAHRNH